MENILEQFKQRVLQETAILIDDLEKNALLLHNNSNDNILIENIFRCTHSIKGSCSMYQFKNGVALAHQLENLYDFVRNNQLAITSNIIQLTLFSAEYIRNLIKNEDVIKESNTKLQEIIEDNINQVLGHASIQQAKSRIGAKNRHHVTGFATWQITFFTEESINTKYINLVTILNRLFSLGSYQIVQNEMNNGKNNFIIFLYTNKTLLEIQETIFPIKQYCTISEIADFDIFDEMALEKHNLIDLKKKNNKSIVENKESTYPELNNQKFELPLDIEKCNELMRLGNEFISTSYAVHDELEKIQYKPFQPIFEKGIDNTPKATTKILDSIPLVSFKQAISCFQNFVNELALQLGKHVQLISHSDEIEIDKTMVEALNIPLMHLIRNSLDHGIEKPDIRAELNKPIKGTIKVTTYRSDGFIFIQIHDDGKGIDNEIIRKKAIQKGIISASAKLLQKEIYDLIFKPGFSTVESPTTISGRGVGMDIAKTKINELGGQIQISSQTGIGTTITIKLPKTIDKY